MWSLKAVLTCVLTAAALSACGTSVKPPQGRGSIDNPRTNNPNYLKCIQDHGLSAVEVGMDGIQVGQLPAGPTIQFLSTPGAATAAQIDGRVQGGEVIGAAVLYPNKGSDSELQAIEGCLDQGVKG
jgi:hypothetical protein